YQRTDQASFDLRRHLPKWAARALKLPGSVVFAGADDEGLAPIAAAVEASLGQRPFREQIVAATALSQGHAVEMDTGEGKTLA
ncbi:hypothetical protein, partial [Burkholderia sp. SIMBA_024]|uniref:hypothetical protein n=1 Tax=Burkholderia sp. SIMBA_024 TaxID=3085768 RepID=UPI00397DA236